MFSKCNHVLTHWRCECYSSLVTAGFVDLVEIRENVGGETELLSENF